MQNLPLASWLILQEGHTAACISHWCIYHTLYIPWRFSTICYLKVFHTYHYAAYIQRILRKSSLRFFLLGRLKLRFQGHVTELLGATSTNSGQEKVAGAAIIHLRPRGRTDGEIWQHFVGLKTTFWLRCPFFYMSKNDVKRLNSGGKKHARKAKLYLAMLCRQCLIDHLDGSIVCSGFTAQRNL